MRNDVNTQLKEFLAGKRLRATSQRNVILALFVEAGNHVSAEELYAQLKKKNPGIGYATIYRTLKLFSEAGLAEERQFGDGFTRFEYKNASRHHDHLICNQCGTIAEFENERIEMLQHDVAKKSGFELQDHKLEIYGLCSACKKQPKTKKRKR